MIISKSKERSVTKFRIPEWPVKFRLAENGYSTELEIEVPDDTFVTGYADGVLIEGAGGQC